ncbi:MAG TPA: RNA 2'-phosphotransferase [Chitinophagaceae bacterium]
MNESEITKISKFLSLVLRHKPGTIELQLDENGWADVTDLLARMNKHGMEITKELLVYVVDTNNKKRFSFDDTQTRIRANQGHSIAVELNLQEADPPEHLYHGTSEKNVASILATGISKGSRQHVHLSIDKETAINVGARYGKPRIFVVAARQMKTDGYTFYLSTNHVWLIDYVPAKYLQLPEHNK